VYVTQCRKVRVFWMWNKVSVACFKALSHICLEEAISHNRRSVSLLTDPELLEYSLGTQTTRYGRLVCSWLLTGNVEGTDRKLRWSIETYLRYGSLGTNAFLLATRPGVENLWQQCRIWHLYIYTSLLKMTDSVTSQNIDFSFWDNLYNNLELLGFRTLLYCTVF
jgi:hypothetical protein